MMELNRKGLADAVAAGELGRDGASDEAIYLVSIMIAGTLSQAMANEPDLPWGEGRFSPLFPKLMSLLPTAYRPSANPCGSPAFTMHSYQHVLPGMSAATASTFAALIATAHQWTRLPDSHRKIARQRVADREVGSPVTSHHQRRRPRSVTWAFVLRWWRGWDLNPRPSGCERLDNRPRGPVENARVRPS